MAEALSSDYDEMELSKAIILISKNAKEVYINKEGIKKTAEEMLPLLIDNYKKFHTNNKKLKLKRPLTYPHENEDSKNANWLFVLHTLNFSLWYPKDAKQWRVDGKTGYFALCNAIKRAIDDDDKPLWDPKYYVKMTRIELEHIFRSDDGETCIPLIDERVRILHEVGEVLLNKYEGTFLECIKSSDNDAEKLLKLLFDEFESYRDEVIYDAKKVRFLMKARSLVNDIWKYFTEKLQFKLNIKKMVSTIFIDYRIPQFLLKRDVLRYSDMLVKRLKDNEPLKYGSREEIEIRGCTLFAVNEIFKEALRMIQHYVEEMPILKTTWFMIPILVDNLLLELAFVKDEFKSFKNLPFNYISIVYY